MRFDDKDIEILKILQNDADLSNQALARAVDLSASACHSRVKNLKTTGLIQGIHAQVDAAALGLNLHVFVFLKLDNQVRDTLAYVEGAVKMNPKVQECFRMTGEYDYSLRLLVKDTEALEWFLTHELSRIPHVASIRTDVAMKCVKQQTAVPL
jgi:Lrp/AsnC family leucine-responsive transcriptional regulator